MAADPGLLLKIKKLLALSQHNDQPAEAAAALAKAQQLMADNDLSSQDVSVHVIERQDLGTKVSISRPKGWEVTLMMTVAKAFGCRVVWNKGRGRQTGHYTFLGEKHRLPLAVYTATFLQRRLYAGRAKFVAGLSDRGYDRRRISTEGDGYCSGWVTAVRSTVHDFALSEAEVQQLNEAEQTMTNGRVVKTTTRTGGHLGTFAGMVDGAKESIYRPMSADILPVPKLL